MALLETASIPDVGSSRKINLVPPIKAMPRDNLRLFPPLKCLENFFISFYKLVFSVMYYISFSIYILFRPLIFAIKRR